ncbi:MAG: S8 family serine peptidase [Spirochaetia bacterium]
MMKIHNRFIFFLICIGFIITSCAHIPEITEAKKGIVVIHGDSNTTESEGPSDSRFHTLLNPGTELGFVRRPAAADYTYFPKFRDIDSFPEYNPDSRDTWQVDVRSSDLRELDLSESVEDLFYASFDTVTEWPEDLPEPFDPERIMRLGRNPGLGLRDLHEQGIDGSGVGIAIIDQALLVEHREYADNLRLYEEIHYHKNSRASMHGPAVASIAVGKNAGAAPGADLYYIAEWHAVRVNNEWKFDIAPIAASIDRIVEINRRLPEDRKIRVISISLRINSRMKNHSLVMEAAARAEEENIHTIYVGSGDTFGAGRYPLADPDDPASYGPGMFWRHTMYEYINDKIVIPMDSRCTAGPSGEDGYAFYRNGGMSWVIPYAAGLYALGCQVNPEMDPEQFWSTLKETAIITESKENPMDRDFGLIVNPKGFIETVRTNGK